MKSQRTNTILLSFAVLALNACAVMNAPETEKAFVQSSLADTATTTAVLGTGVGYEGNPVGFAGATAVKVGLYLYAKDLPKPEQESIYQASSAAFAGASINNLLVLIGSSTPASLFAGVMGAIYIYMNKPDQQAATAVAHAGEAE